MNFILCLIALLITQSAHRVYSSVNDSNDIYIISSIMSCCWFEARFGHKLGECFIYVRKTLEFVLKLLELFPLPRSTQGKNFHRLCSDREEVFANGPFSAFFNDFEIFNGPFLIILHRLLWAIFQLNGTMAHGPLPSQSLIMCKVWCSYYCWLYNLFIVLYMHSQKGGEILILFLCGLVGFVVV